MTSLSKDCGIIFATIGKNYTDIAMFAARTARLACPSIDIDLFTDQDLSEAPHPFSAIHTLKGAMKRPKIEALSRSRFEKTIYLDADVCVVDDLSQIFEVLDIFEVTATHDWVRGNWHEMDYEAVEPHYPRALPSLYVNHRFPAAFPKLNSGVMGVRRTDRTLAFLAAWLERMEAHAQKTDQPLMRECLVESGASIWVLPPEYNIFYTAVLETWSSTFGAPKVLHAPKMHRENPIALFSSARDDAHLKDVMIDYIAGKRLGRHIRELVAWDNSGPAAAGEYIRSPFERRICVRLRSALRRLSW